ncbi:MAG TPA: DUF1579 domain-containing protein [Chitinophagaceae bacterium]|nr:DUF1579 domain-containing protein [Chitinophagaceae bacterium]
MRKIILTLCFASVLYYCGNSQTMDSAAMMKAWQSFMTPGDMQKMLAKSNGVWDEEVTTWMDPSKPAVKSMATCTNKMVMNGLYQESVHKGTMMGMPFEGHGTVGYDNAKKVFVSSWIDNMGSGIMNTEGAWDNASNSLVMKGKTTDPMSGKDVDVKEVLKFPDDNHQTLEMYGAGPDGKEMKMMEIKFTRKK